MAVIADGVRMTELEENVDLSSSKLKRPQERQMEMMANQKPRLMEMIIPNQRRSHQHLVVISKGQQCYHLYHQHLPQRNYQQEWELYDKNESLRDKIKELKKPKQWYPEGHPNVKYTFLNMLPINAMHRDGGEKEMFARKNTD